MNVLMAESRRLRVAAPLPRSFDVGQEGDDQRRVQVFDRQP
jgi:hypothetical protein